MPLRKEISILFLLIIGCEYKNDTSLNGVFVSNFPEEKEAAISYTFDDNCPSSLTLIAPLFKKYGYKATFFVITNTINEIQWEQWRELSKSGFEIGNHSFSHLNLEQSLDTAILNREINLSYATIQTKIGKAPFSFAHPFHKTNTAIDKIVFQKHFASRVSPQGFCDWWGLAPTSTEKMVDSNFEKALKNHTWIVICGHGVNDDCYEPVTQSFLEYSLKVIKKDNLSIWVDTFENLSKYKIEKENLILKIVELNDKMFITLEASLNPEVFNYPLTLVIKNPDYRNGKISPLENTKIMGVTFHDNKLYLKLLPNSKIQIEKW